jgi:hypothetical protein
VTPRLLPIACLLAALAPAPARPVALAGDRVGVHLGSGGGGWRIGGTDAWFGDALAQGPLRVSVAADWDRWIAVPFRAGARASMLYLGAGNDGTRTSLTIGRLEALAKLHPGALLGPYLQAGLGPAFLHHRVVVPGLAEGTLTAWGGSLSLAAGLFAAGDGGPELRLEAEVAAQAWLPSDGGPDLSLTFGGSVGVAW